MMKEEAYSQLFENEEGHWWHRSLRNKISFLIRKYAKNQLKILDAGCGTGYGLVFFRRYGEVQGIDSSDTAISFCRERGIGAVQKASIESIPFPDAHFDLTICADVLSYLSDDAVRKKAVREFARTLKRGGLLIVNVPALSFLLGSHDKEQGFDKRFTLDEVRDLLPGGGFEVIRASYIFSTTFMPLLVRRYLGRLGIIKRSDLVPIPRWLNVMLFCLAEIDTFLFRYFDLPVGSSILCIAKKK